MQASEISPSLVMEPADRQAATNLPVYVKPADFSRYEQNTLCGFGEIGSADTNYKHCLVRVVLRPEYRHLLELVKSEMTVQVTGILIGILFCSTNCKLSGFALETYSRMKSASWPAVLRFHVIIIICTRVQQFANSDPYPIYTVFNIKKFFFKNFVKASKQRKN